MANTAVEAKVMQGIEVPATAVDAAGFFARTNRQIFQFSPRSFTGFGTTDVVPVAQTGIISGIHLHLTGTLTVTLGGGTCASTPRWPYDLVRNGRLSANGQSNLINCSGWELKARDIMSRGDLTDRGVARGSGGASPGTARTQGTLSLAAEEWGVGQAVTGIPGAPTVYPLDLSFFVPIAMDQVSLIGSIFAQTSATDLVLALQYAQIADLFTLTGAATVVLAAQVVPEAIVYDIPQGPDGQVIVPDLSQFHSLIGSRFAPFANGVNEINLVGQGVGRQLLRVYGRSWNGAGVGAPLPVNAINYSSFGYRYGGNTTPEDYVTALTKRFFDERMYNSDIGGLQGFWGLDWVTENAFRDTIDEGAASQLRLLMGIPSALALTNPAFEFVQETLFSGATGA